MFRFSIPAWPYITYIQYFDRLDHGSAARWKIMNHWFTPVSRLQNTLESTQCRSGTTDSMTCLHWKIYEIMLINSMNHCETINCAPFKRWLGLWRNKPMEVAPYIFPDHFESQLCFKEPACLTTLPRHQKTTLPMRLVAKSWHGLPQGKHSKRAIYGPCCHSDSVFPPDYPSPLLKNKNI